MLPTTPSVVSLLITQFEQYVWFREAETVQEIVLDTSQTVLGDRNPDTLAATTNLGSTYWEQGRYLDAMKTEESVPEARRFALGDLHPVRMLIP